MRSSSLSVEQRAEALSTLRSGATLDVLVVGGGVTGVGIALDAASRGLRTAIVEAQDWAAGTSSRSSKLLHGGLRYLQMLDFELVHEAILERNLLLRVIAPHLAVPTAFLYPLRVPVLERAFVGAGVSLYDALAVVGGRRAVPVHRNLGREALAEAFPGLRSDAFVGAIKYWDARIDDARLVTTLLRTAVQQGALAVSRTQVVDYTKDESGGVTGAALVDLESNETFPIAATQVINATGVWTEKSQALAGDSSGLRVLMSKGAHIVVPRDRIAGSCGIITRTEKSVLFVIPWQHYWLIGTTDTPWQGDQQHPVATASDIDYLLEKVNAILEHPLSREDVTGSFAGLRPLLQPGTQGTVASTSVSREHTVTSPVPGLTVIAGGKLTTYRVMAKDAVDFAIGPELAAAHPSITHDLPLVGAAGLSGVVAKRDQIERIYGWGRDRVNRLINRYGTALYELLEQIGDDDDLADALADAPDYLRAEIAYAVTHEGAAHLEDVLVRRTRLAYEQRDRGRAAAHEIVEVIAPLLGWSRRDADRELTLYLARCDALDAAAEQQTELAADDERLAASDVVPMIVP